MFSALPCYKSYSNTDIRTADVMVTATTFDNCWLLCEANAACKAIVYNAGNCHQKGTSGPLVSDAASVGFTVGAFLCKDCRFSNLMDRTEECLLYKKLIKFIFYKNIQNFNFSSKNSFHKKFRISIFQKKIK